MQILADHWIVFLGLGVFVLARLIGGGSNNGGGGGGWWDDCGDGGDGGD